jgi:two-component system, chemotaxis family, sensor kinase CheA
VRKKVGAQLGGIDLPGFIKQIDGLLAELRPEPKQVRLTTSGMHPIKAAAPMPRVPAAVRSRLAGIAVDAFIEYASARGLRRDRLRTSWHALRDLTGMHRAVVGSGQLAKHKTGAQTLARELDKQVEITMEIDSVEATAEILSAIDMAVLHLMRNAVDHGIEAAAERVAAGKPEKGAISVRGRTHGDEFTMTVADDGRGVVIEHVRARALELGFITPAETDIADRWFDLVCHPGFTTRKEANDVSGRGVGLDAVRVGVYEVGGRMSANTQPGNGTEWILQIPLPKITFEAHVVRVPGAAFPIVIDGSWRPIDDAPNVSPAPPVVDIAHRLGLTEERAHAPVRYFTRDNTTVGIVAERAPVTMNVRQLIVVPHPAVAEVVLIEATEGLLVHLDRAAR